MKFKRQPDVEEYNKKFKRVRIQIAGMNHQKMVLSKCFSVYDASINEVYSILFKAIQQAIE